MSHSSVRSVPDRAALMFSSAELERGLIDRAIAVQPNHQALGMSKMVVHDTVTAVVREIVGIFEGLLDRLLVEKKGDVLRAMVAELMTEDLAATLAVGRDQLKKQELGHITEELARLRTEFQEREVAWEQRFDITTELKDSHDDLWTTLDGRCKDIEHRLGSVETDFVQSTELNARMQAVTDEFDSLRGSVSSNTSSVDGVLQQFSGLDKHCRENFVTAATLEDRASKMDANRQEIREHMDTTLDEFRSDFARKSELQQAQTTQAERFRQLTSEVFEVSQDVDLLKTQLKKDQCTNSEMFATKVEQQTAISRVRKEREDTATELREMLKALEGVTATKQAVAQDQRAKSKEIAEVAGRATRILEQLDSVGQRVVTMEAFLNSTKEKSWATQQDVEELAQRHAARAATAVDPKETIAQLRREFEEERERLRQNTRQQQSSRKDINELSDTLHTVKRQSHESQKQLCDVRDGVEGHASRQEEHRQRLQTENAELRHKQRDLEMLFHSVRDDLSSHVESQKVEGERLRDHSTHRYLEQMDKALAMHSSLDQLKATVVKLPRVS